MTQNATVRIVAGLGLLLGAAALLGGRLSLGSETATVAVGSVDLLLGTGLLASGVRSRPSGVMGLEDSRTFEADPETVWAVISDPELYAEVAPNLSRVERLEGDGEGMVRECADADGRTWTETCTAWEPGRRYAVDVHVADSPVHRPLFRSFAGEWAMAPAGDGVRVTMTFEYEPRYGPLGRLLGRFGEREGRRLTAAILDGWERELERRSAESDAA